MKSTTIGTLAGFRKALKERSEGVCELQLEGCTRWASVSHHILMQSHGHNHSPDNGLHLCVPCHARVHTQNWVSYERGWLRREFPRPGDFFYEGE